MHRYLYLQVLQVWQVQLALQELLKQQERLVPNKNLDLLQKLLPLLLQDHQEVLLDHLGQKTKVLVQKQAIPIPMLEQALLLVTLY